jgi:hypothetical protein
MTTRALHTGQLLLALTLLIAAEAASGLDTDCRYSAEREASIDTAGATHIEIVGRGGSLEVRPTPGTTAKGHGRACASSEAYLAQTQLHARRDGNVIHVYVQVPDEMSGIGTFYATLDLVVDVPAALPVRITDTSGALTARQLTVTHLTDSSGEILLRDLRGDIEINDSSGDLRVENSSGRVRINDSSGDIFVRGAADVEIPSDSSGEIVLEKIAGSVRIDQDSSGAIRVAGVGKDVTVLADSSGEVSISDVKGTVRLP